MLCFVSVCTSTYYMEDKMTLIITVNLQMRVSAKVHAQLSNVHRTNSYLDEPHERNYWNSILGIHMNSCY